MKNYARVERSLSDGHRKKLKRIKKENEKIRFRTQLINSMPVRKLVNP